MNKLQKELLYVGAGIVGLAGLICGIDRIKMHPTIPEYQIATVREEPVASQKYIKILKSEKPVYPNSARNSGIEGKVIVEVAIDSLGNVVDADISSTSNNQDLDYSAIEAAKGYKFEFPKGFEYKDTVHMIIPFEYKLN